ncbi:MAG: two-component system response regulator [Bacteroidetes bacterium GWE2_42_24]|nr:MAG: two-component system response regulator [Bacteroidetes bacterium GWE2_42_24]OFY32299.1 MAG: two-component system response regulator [Bacteroidetes bacterium GWF2_43_11]
MKKKILVIDDEQSIRLLLENFLKKEYEVATKANGEEGLLWLETNVPHLIICDIQMPVLDGYAFIAKVRASGFQKHTPILMLSGEENSESRVKCFRLGAQDFLVKPFNFQELEELIKKNIFPIHFALEW